MQEGCLQLQSSLAVVGRSSPRPALGQLRTAASERGGYSCNHFSAVRKALFSFSFHILLLVGVDCCCVLWATTLPALTSTLLWVQLPVDARVLSSCCHWSGQSPVPIGTTFWE